MSCMAWPIAAADRQGALEALFIEPARRAPERRFRTGQITVPDSVREQDPSPVTL